MLGIVAVLSMVVRSSEEKTVPTLAVRSHEQVELYVA